MKERSMDEYTISKPVLETLDPEIGARLAKREAEIAQGASIARVTAAGLAMASVPVALAALARDVFAQGGLPANVVSILNFALMHEYMETTLYNYGLSAHFAVVPAQDLPIFQTIQAHENLHQQYLLATLGSQAVREPFFDFSGGGGTYNGPYHAAFYVYDEWKALSQSFEDLGVRLIRSRPGTRARCGGSVATSRTPFPIAGGSRVPRRTSPSRARSMWGRTTPSRTAPTSRRWASARPMRARRSTSR
jgi:hypothetical protein